MAAGITAVALIFSFAQTNFVQNNSILGTISQISFKEVTFQTRLISWKAAMKDFPNHPILGAGYGNYAITFDKYFDPKFYTFTSSETYFDRAHNNLVDIASTAGSVGLLSYLSIFAAIGYYLFKGKKNNVISNNEFILLLCLFTAYFIQNLVVFDSLVTYISLMMALGYVYWLVNQEEDDEAETESGFAFTNQELTVLAIAGLIFLSIAYQYNFKVWSMLDGTINGQKALVRGDLAGAVQAYKEALSYNTPLDRDSRKSLINSINGLQGSLSSIDKQQAKDIAEYVVSLAEANVKYNPLDSMMQMQLAQALSSASLVNQDDINKFYFYSDRALKAIDESIKASPGRVTVYFTKAQIYLIRNDKDKALDTLRYAYNLNQKYTESSCYLAKVEIYFKEEAQGYADMDECLDLGGVGNLAPLDLVKISLNHYTEKKDDIHVLSLLQRWTALEPDNTKVWINLSLLYAQKGDKINAIDAAKKAGELDPSLKSAVEEFIKKLGE